VADVEQAGVGTHGLVFLQDAGVLYWHIPAAKRDKAGALFGVEIVERDLLNVGHGRS